MLEALIDRKAPPQNLEAEACVIGSMLLSPECIEEVVAILPDACAFFDQINAQVYRLIVAMFRARVPVDTVTFGEWTSRDSFRAEAVGFAPTEYLVDLWNRVPSAANVMHYAQIVREHYQRRTLAMASLDASNRLAGETGPDELKEAVGDLQERCASTMEWGALGKTQRLSELAKVALEAGTRSTRIDFGLPSLDRFTPFRGEYQIAGARPSTGKTTLLLQLAWNVACRGDAVLFFSQEMPAGDLALRLLSMLSGIQVFDLRTGSYPSEMEGSLQWAREQLQRNDDKLIFAPRQASIDSMNAEVKRFRRQHPTASLVCVDYLQLVDSGGRGETRHEQLGHVSAQMNAWKHDGLAVVVASQLNRDQARTDREPQLTDLRESGKIEEDADIVWLLHRKDRKQCGPRDVNVIVAKNRNGATGEVQLVLDPRAFLFRDPTDALKGAIADEWDG